MKNNLIKGCLALCALGVLLTLTLGTFTHANSSTLGIPGAAGRPMQDTITNARVEGMTVGREIMDTSAITTGSINSSGSLPLNVTFVAGTCFCASSVTVTAHGYVGPYIVNLYSAVAYYAYVNTTPTTISNTVINGTNYQAAGTACNISVGNRDGETVHVQAVGTPGTVNYSVSTK